MSVVRISSLFYLAREFGSFSLFRFPLQSLAGSPADDATRLLAASQAHIELRATYFVSPKDIDPI